MGVSLSTRNEEILYSDRVEADPAGQYNLLISLVGDEQVQLTPFRQQPSQLYVSALDNTGVAVQTDPGVTFYITIIKRKRV